MEHEWNPRYRVWAGTLGKKPEDFGRDRHGDLILIEDPEDDQRRKMPWTIVYSLWVQARWREWALCLGFQDTRRAQLFLSDHQGHFDSWLTQRYGGQHDDHEGYNPHS